VLLEDNTFLANETAIFTDKELPQENNRFFGNVSDFSAPVP